MAFATFGPFHRDPNNFASRRFRLILISFADPRGEPALMDSASIAIAA
jgi:hypothetical protein